MSTAIALWLGLVVTSTVAILTTLVLIWRRRGERRWLAVTCALAVILYLGLQLAAYVTV